MSEQASQGLVGVAGGAVTPQQQQRCPAVACPACTHLHCPAPLSAAGPLLTWVGTDYAPPPNNATGIARNVSPRPSRLFPGFCTAGTKWWVERLRPGAALLPRDLYSAMVSTRAARLARP